MKYQGFVFFDDPIPDFQLIFKNSLFIVGKVTRKRIKSSRRREQDKFGGGILERMGDSVRGSIVRGAR